ncbi:morphogenetic protein [Klebsiella grimontii]|uniref:morphogenetic protein n=1 Tax=Klebsiella grimontii TaxID=2058152 RepID=UPI0015E4EC3D|nr:morphogenetic protein [Klebsiella grimontii]QLN80197.1 morphogenetic protein [Klebsiella grimontii]
MKERGMIFNGEMVRAILDGRKTQTRRTVKQQPDEDGLAKVTNGPWVDTSERNYRCPFGDVGDCIWVRETFQGPLFDYEQMEAYLEDSSGFEKPEFCQYAADGGHRPEYQDADDNLRHGWRPSIHMPRWASRITLEITGVRVERLNAISEEDAIAEGMQGVICPCCKGDSEYSTSQYDAETLAVVDEIPCRACESNRSKFFTLWDSIYGYGQHCIGEWVWVIEFKVVNCGGD